MLDLLNQFFEVFLPIVYMYTGQLSYLVKGLICSEYGHRNEQGCVELQVFLPPGTV